MEENFEMKASLYKKMNAFRADVIQCDWKDDKMVSLGGTKGYPYLSSDKIIKNLAPLLVKHGIELDVEFGELTSCNREGMNHWTLKATVRFTDVETGYSTTSAAYGEGQDSQDKGIAKAQTAAFKKCLSAKCMIADGIDPDAVDIYEPKSFFKRSTEEQEEVKSKVLANSIKPTETPKEEPKVEEVPVVPKEDMAVKKGSVEVPVKTSEPQTVTEPPTTGVPTTTNTKYEPSGPHKGAIDRILKAYEEKAKAGEITSEEYNNMSMDRVTMSSPADAVAFIRKYRDKV